MLKIMTIVGTRPEIIKMCRVINEFEKHTNHILVHTGQNYDYELNEIFFNELEIKKPDYFLDAGGKDEISMTAYIIEQMKILLNKEKPNYVVVYGDITSTLGAALAAKKMNIALIHIESGVRNYDLNMPEELNRIIVDRISDINICATRHCY